MAHPSQAKVRILFIVLSAFFISNAIIAEFIGAKIFSLEGSLGIPKANLPILGYNLSFDLTAGVILWPIVFTINDIINEYFGRKGVRLLSWLTAGLIAYAFVMVYFAMSLQPSDFWVQGTVSTPDNPAVPIHASQAFDFIFGQGLWIIVGSLLAFLVGQVVDVYFFQFLRSRTGAKLIWFRAVGSTIVSQLFDSFIVLFVAFYISGRFPLSQVLAIGAVNFIYKVTLAFMLVPLLYLLHYGIKRYLGEPAARMLAHQASLGK